MKTTRHIRPNALHVTISIILVGAFVVAYFSTVFMLQFRSIANDAVVSATEATALAERCLTQSKALQAKNEELTNRLSLLDEFNSKDPTPPRYFNIELSEELQSYLWIMCCDYGISEHYELALALMKHESKFDAAAMSRSNDYGLFQINECNHEWLYEHLNIVDFLDPYDNINAGVYMLASLLYKYDVPDALMAYNMGENGAAELWRRGIHSTPYTEQVLDYYNQFTGDI